MVSVITLMRTAGWLGGAGRLRGDRRDTGVHRVADVQDLRLRESADLEHLRGGRVERRDHERGRGGLGVLRERQEDAQPSARHVRQLVTVDDDGLHALGAREQPRQLRLRGHRGLEVQAALERDDGRSRPLVKDDVHGCLLLPAGDLHVGDHHGARPEGHLLLDGALDTARDKVEAADLEDALLEAAQLGAAEEAAQQTGDRCETDEHRIAGAGDGIAQQHRGDAQLCLLELTPLDDRVLARLEHPQEAGLTGLDDAARLEPVERELDEAAGTREELRVQSTTECWGPAETIASTSSRAGSPVGSEETTRSIVRGPPRPRWAAHPRPGDRAGELHEAGAHDPHAEGRLARCGGDAAVILDGKEAQLLDQADARDLRVEARVHGCLLEGVSPSRRRGTPHTGSSRRHPRWPSLAEGSMPRQVPGSVEHELQQGAIVIELEMAGTLLDRRDDRLRTLSGAVAGRSVDQIHELGIAQ